jgi:hypothetical protein
MTTNEQWHHTYVPPIYRPSEAVLIGHYMSSTLRIPFKTAEQANIARRVILVDRELNAHLVERSLTVEGNELVAYVLPSYSLPQKLFCGYSFLFLLVCSAPTVQRRYDSSDSPQTGSSRTCSSLSERYTNLRHPLPVYRSRSPLASTRPCEMVSRSKPILNIRNTDEQLRTS